MKKGIKQRERKKRVRIINDTNPDGNRNDRRAKNARERQMPGIVKKRNIRNAHDKILQ